jgi:hypothetical protein
MHAMASFPNMLLNKNKPKSFENKNTVATWFQRLHASCNPMCEGAKLKLL